MGAFIDLTGEKFGRLTVLRRMKSNKKKIIWECVCTCNVVCSVIGDDLRSGNTKSCGCLKKETTIARSTTHGLGKHLLYTVWKHMRERCYYMKDKYYKDYGGRGITICSLWKNDFNCFHDWALSHGWEKGLQIDRRNNDQHYTPSNCRFVTGLKNMTNQRLLRQDNSSGFRGVKCVGSKFVARYRKKGNLIHIGTFTNKVKAAIHRDNIVLQERVASPLNFPELFYGGAL